MFRMFVLTWLAVGFGAAGGPILLAQEYAVDTVHSTIIFRIKHLNYSYSYGRFNDITGQFFLDRANPEKSTMKIEVKMSSIDTANADRDKHLKGPDFFNVAQFPTASFKSTKITPQDNEQFQVEGDLTICGVTKPVRFVAKMTGEGPSPFGDQRQGFEAQVLIKRSDFNVKYAPQMLGDEVGLTISFEGMRK